jgi:hypothetical protein
MLRNHIGLYRMHTTRVALALAALLAAGAVTPALAAVKVCVSELTHVGTDRVSEQTARRKAMTGWTTAATSIGVRFALWQLSDRHILSCIREPVSGYVCTAKAKPCAILQNPNSRPDWLPKPAPPA